MTALGMMPCAYHFCGPVLRDTEEEISVRPDFVFPGGRRVVLKSDDDGRRFTERALWWLLFRDRQGEWDPVIKLRHTLSPRDRKIIAADPTLGFAWCAQVVPNSVCEAHAAIDNACIRFNGMVTERQNNGMVTFVTSLEGAETLDHVRNIASLELAKPIRVYQFDTSGRGVTLVKCVRE
jgi:hypothetical protein